MGLDATDKLRVRNHWGDRAARERRFCYSQDTVQTHPPVVSEIVAQPSGGARDQILLPSAGRIRCGDLSRHQFPRGV